jgi:hypothetical protein
MAQKIVIALAQRHCFALLLSFNQHGVASEKNLAPYSELSTARVFSSYAPRAVAGYAA